MNKVIHFFLFLIICFSFFNCNKKCVEDQMGVLKFTPDELKINPYTGDELLTFKNFNGDTIVFPRGVRETQVFKIHEHDHNTALTYYNGCAGNYFLKDYNWMVKYESSNSRLDINLIFMQSALNKPTNEKVMNLYFWFDSTYIYCFSGYYQFNADTIFNRPYPGDSIVSYSVLLKIGPKTYSNVYELFCENSDSRNSEWVSTAFYSIKEGLVGFKTNIGKMWFLDKITK